MTLTFNETTSTFSGGLEYFYVDCQHDDEQFQLGGGVGMMKPSASIYDIKFQRDDEHIFLRCGIVFDTVFSKTTSIF